MVAENTNPNFYILLGLDPDASWDQTKFEQALSAKRSEWSRQSAGVGARAIAAQRYRELIPQITQVMEDPAQRSVQAVTAKKELASANQQRISIFESQLKNAQAKGYLEKAELEKFIADFKDVLSEKDIRNRVKVPVRTPGQRGTKSTQQLEPSVVKDITEKLKTLNILDLYQLLAMPRTTSCQELSRAAQQLYGEMMSRQPKTAEVTAKSDLAGYARDIFQSEEKRGRYDESLRQSSLNALLKEQDEVINRTGEQHKTLYVGQVADFLQKAAEKGWKNDLALEKLREHALQRKWAIEVPTLEFDMQQQRCGYCQAINDKTRNYCFQCNKELSSRCPDCDQRVPSDELVCGNCGFPTGNGNLVDELLSECGYLLSKQDVEAAEAQLRIVERAWMPKKPDVRMQRILEYRTQVQRLVQSRQQKTEQLRQLIDTHQLYAARQILAKLAPGTLADQLSFQQTVASEISHAQDLLKRAQAAGLSSEQKIDLCLQALRICTDFQDARDLLSTLPPEPPGNLQARVGGSTVSLRWDASLSRGVSYKIVRKSGSQSVSMKDGVLLETVSGRMCDDINPEIGAPLFYSVFAAYDEVISTQAATLSRPVLLTQEVSNVNVRVDDHLVDLSWQLPAYIHNVVVVRATKMPPQSIHDGTRLTLVDLNHFVDHTVENNCMYFYGIYCQFKDYDNKIVTSTGVVKNATPETPPAIITDMDVTSTRVSNGHEVRLTWQPPSKGHVVVLKSVQPVPFEPGESVRQELLNKHGQILEERTNTLKDTWNAPGIGYYTPIVIFQGMAYIGTTQRYVSVDDVSDLKYQNLGNALRLQWEWPTNCQEVLVSYSYDGWQKPDEAQANTQKVTSAEYDFHGHYDIRGTNNSDHYIVVAAIVKQGNEQIIASGARIHARLASKIVIGYEIKHSRGLFGPKQRTLHVYVRTPGTLPTLLIVSKHGRLPNNKAEGELLYRHEGPIHVEKDLEIVLPDKSFPPKTFGKLYLEDDSLYNVVNVNHPSVDKLRLA